VTFEFYKGLVVQGAHLKGSKMENDGPPKTISVPEAGWRYFKIRKNAAYAAAARREIPTIRIGGRLRVPVVALERMLAAAGSDKAA
jgi:hypothetical protein